MSSELIIENATNAPMDQSISQLSISEGNCIICDLSTTLNCKECLKSGKSSEDIPFYCGKKHQVAHWKAGHKNSCGKNGYGWKEMQTNGINNDLLYYVATEDLKPGHALFTKQPLLTYPQMTGPGEEQFIVPLSQDRVISAAILSSRELQLKLWTCVSCYEVLLHGEMVEDSLNGLRMNKCTDCGWPLHTNVGRAPSDCQELHAKECAILTANGITWDTMKKDNFVYDKLGLLRAVLLPTELKQELLNLPVSFPQYFDFLESGRSDPRVSFVREKCNLADQVSTEELKKMIFIIFSNVLKSSYAYDSIRRKLVCTIFQGGSTGRILSHECNPNCDFYVNPKTLAATFKTIRNVRKGEILTINYARRQEFPAHVHDRVNSFCHFFMPFFCSCVRCNDPTEGGTFASAIKCRSEKKSNVKDCQYLVPFPKPQDISTGGDDIIEWRCLCRRCPGVIRQKDAEQLFNETQAQIFRARDQLDYEKLKSIVLRISGKLVHPSSSLVLHAYLHMFCVAYIHINLSVKDPEFRFDLHNKYLPDLSKTLELTKVYQFGRSGTYGALLFAHSLLKMSELAQKISTPTERPGLDDFEKSLGSIMANLKESWIIFKDSPYYYHPNDIIRERKLRNVYANHLGKMIRGNGTDYAGLPTVQTFFKKYNVDNVNCSE